MKRVIVIAGLCMGLAAVAQDKPKQMPEELKTKFFKAQALYERAQAISEQAKTNQDAATTALQQSVADISKWCGTGKAFALDKDNDPSCVDDKPAPEPAKK
jgi:hypothetical protein